MRPVVFVSLSLLASTLLAQLGGYVAEETIFSGEKQVTDSWTGCLQTTLHTTPAWLVRVRFKEKASGTTLLDGRKKSTFENTSEVNLTTTATAGKHEFKIQVNSPATLTSVGGINGTQTCPQ